MYTLLGNRILPGLLDRYLARTGYRSQQTDEPVPTHRPDNLFDPVEDDHDAGAHGRFGDRARGTSPQMWVSRHRGAVAAAGVAAAAGALAGRLGWSSRR